MRELPDRSGVEEERIPRRRGRCGQRGELAAPGNRAAERGVAIEGIAAPRTVEIAPFRQLARGAPEAIDGAVGPVAAVGRPHAAPERAPHARRRILEPLVQPAAKRVGKQLLGARLGEHVEQRIGTRFDWTFAHQIGAEAVDGADVRFFESLDRVRQVLVSLRIA